MHTPDSDDEITRWALAAGRGDRAAASSFIQATQHQVIRFLGHLTDATEAEDLAQETYLRAMKSLPRFAGRSSAKTWLLSIARRVAVDHVRAVTVRPRVAALENWEHAAEATLARGVPHRFEDEIVLRDLLDALPADRREAFVATQIAGLSYAEAAEVCDCPVGTIRSRVARAREDLVGMVQERRRDGRNLRASG
ncbi:sigma-70 family RNA polymerase sigma factor [Polymorphospora rubra]|uniref:RNA polymerase sigma factor n=1 Tax=Polymorphospora rubra TaxID=338584 RepID=A0A810N595_9ACTN|nr:sigma-70 family RNA polymerase sigma factor [Polymorphospora rubra]BCJ68682.1 RNA polymerase sigma factor [Polymorphospora rubra]